jgi:hypothetical protein
LRMSCLRNSNMKALREMISCWVGLGPSEDKHRPSHRDQPAHAHTSEIDISEPIYRYQKSTESSTTQHGAVCMTLPNPDEWSNMRGQIWHITDGWLLITAAARHYALIQHLLSLTSLCSVVLRHIVFERVE